MKDLMSFAKVHLLNQIAILSRLSPLVTSHLAYLILMTLFQALYTEILCLDVEEVAILEHYNIPSLFNSYVDHLKPWVIYSYLQFPLPKTAITNRKVSPRIADIDHPQDKTLIDFSFDNSIGFQKRISHLLKEVSSESVWVTY